MEQDYFVPHLAYGEDSFSEKRSRFIGRLWRVESADQALALLKQTRETYRDAAHHCFAYRIRQDNLMRYSDDGEPQGTAGMPILEVLRHEQMQNVLCVVTRYFGGILLGTGGLARAYTEGAKLAVARAGVARMSLYAVLLIACPYPRFEMVQRLLPDFDCTIEQTDFGADVTLSAIIPAGGVQALNTALAELTAGRVYAEAIETKFMGRQVK